MELNYILQDEQGNLSSPGAQAIPVIQGETKNIQVLLFQKNGLPFVYKATVTEIFVKVFSQITQASIQKKLSLSSVDKIMSADLGGMIGFSFTLSSTDTPNMAVNNSGLPMSVSITDNSGNVSEIDFQGSFSVSAPLVGLTSAGP